MIKFCNIACKDSNNSRFLSNFAVRFNKICDMDNLKEKFPIVDEEGQVIGSATRGECHNGSRLLHPVVHLHVFNSKGDIYLQKRPEWKDIQPVVYVNRTTYDGPIQPSAEELDGGRFWTMDEIREAMGQGILTPNFESEFQRCFV